MFGVVLWSDQVRNRAVIWCEDHGDLAFFNGDSNGALDGADMDPGDLVHFEVRVDRHMRLACNPRLVATDEYPTLARDLKEARTEPVKPVVQANKPGDAKIIAFEQKPANSIGIRKPARRVI
ncbi:hypothetical protein [uncultured Roseovarius sp.]|uniref:hypothetical protein n=1 Tax=uncultured Roseovarius sp. TaxID=293344 RepID=UPI0026167464|nr:hypothetical protein [uncultured Roseovarius sp.]